MYVIPQHGHFGTADDTRCGSFDLKEMGSKMLRSAISMDYKHKHDVLDRCDAGEVALRTPLSIACAMDISPQV
jgi:hypothetical protein